MSEQHKSEPLGVALTRDEATDRTDDAVVNIDENTVGRPDAADADGEFDVDYEAIMEAALDQL